MKKTHDWTLWIVSILLACLLSAAPPLLTERPAEAAGAARSAIVNPAGSPVLGTSAANTGQPELVSIPGGVFRMGDTAGDLEPVCRPVHEVELIDYRLGARLVSGAETARVFNWALQQKLVTVAAASVNLTGGAREQLLNLAGLKGITPDIRFEDGRLTVTEGRKNYPCIFITWYGAAAYCNFRSQMEGLAPCFSFTDWSCDFGKPGYRLPTEAEYEYAARGRGREIKYPWGDGTPLVDGKPAANVADDTGEAHFARLNVTWRPPLPLPWPGYADGYATTSPVDAFPPNPLGLYDMAGNVWEFLYDWYGPYSAERQTCPAGPATGTRRCMRGGSWMNPDPHVFRCSYRDEDKPSFQYFHAGFRLARRAGQ